MFEVLLITFLVLVVLWHKIRSYYWIKRNIVGPKPWPVVGNFSEHFFRRKTMGEVIGAIYRSYEDLPFVGIFRATTPSLLVRDPEFVTNILVKDQKYFADNAMYINKKYNPLLGQNPFNLRGREWRYTRQLIAPGFSSAKMRQYFHVVNDMSDKLVTFISNHPTAASDGIDTKNLTRRYTSDTLAVVAFGLDGGSLDSYTKNSQFMQLADTILPPNSLNGLLVQLNLLIPFLGQLFPAKFVPKATEIQIRKLVSHITKKRRENNIQYQDYFQFILDLARSKKISNADIAAHGVTFLFGGYETVTYIFLSLLFNLAMYPEYQDKIRTEIYHLEEKITYETLYELRWIEACIYETLRYTPFTDLTYKICTQPYKYTSTNPTFKKMNVKLYPGDNITLPYSLMMNDPKYCKNPNEFMPERMMDEGLFDKSVFFPFGAGPRTCMGQRFAMMQLKLGALKVLKNFEISIGSKTELPRKVIPFHFINELRGEVWLKYKKISANTEG